jgi:transcriptional regulator with XRE-family HTH domain
MQVRTTRSHVEADRPLARRIGARLRAERLQRGLTQAQLAEGRYTKAYVSALENGHIKPSMAALNFLAGRLGIPATTLMGEDVTRWSRLEADLRLASGDWGAAVEAYSDVLSAGEPSPAIKAQLLRGLAEALCRLERGPEAVRAATQAVELFLARGNTAEAARATYWQANGLYLLENSVEARRLLAGILDQLRGGLVLDPDFKARVLIALAAIETRDGHGDIAMSYLEEARGLGTELDDRRRATFAFTLAISDRELGDLEGALSLGLQALALFRASESDLEVASVENSLALVHLDRGSFDLAREQAAQARAAYERLGNERLLAHVVDTEARIDLESGDIEKAVALGSEAVALGERTGNKKAFIDASLTLARARRRQGDRRGAIGILENAANAAREHGRRVQLESLLGEWADIVAEDGDHARAYELSREALAVSRSRNAS